jgi:ABC-type branched-subunit amino acid transport system ATPase component
VKALKLKFGGITALNNIDLTVRTGELVAIIGPNGAGKTSLLNCITGYYKPQEGQILFRAVIPPNFNLRLFTSNSARLSSGRAEAKILGSPRNAFILGF